MIMKTAMTLDGKNLLQKQGTPNGLREKNPENLVHINKK